jgi:lysozyme
MSFLTVAEATALAADLVADEGFRAKAYRDTVGKLTIGIGRNLDDNGISRAEADFLLANDIETAANGLALLYPWVSNLDSVRRRVLVNMAFNMGLGTLAQFVATLHSVQIGDYAKAADQMLASKWASQVGARAQRLAVLMRTGSDTAPTRTTKALQAALNAFGSYGLVVDGIPGKATSAALKAFQAAAKLPITGSADDATWNALDAATR